MTIRSRLLLILAPSLLVIFGGLIFVIYNMTKSSVLNHVGHEAMYFARSYGNEIDGLTGSATKVAEGMANAVQVAPNLDDNSIQSLIKTTLIQNPLIYGATIALSPGSTNLGQYSPYFFRGHKGLLHQSLAKPSYNYTSWDWYKTPIKTERGAWAEPYYDREGGNTLMTTYSTPIFKDDRIIGVATVDLSLDTLTKRVKSLKVDGTGYAFIVSGKGHYIAHPDKELLSKETIMDYGGDSADPDLKRLSLLLTKDSGSNSVSIIDPFTGKKSWIVTTPIVSAGWIFAIIFPRNEILLPLTRLWNVSIAISIIVFALLLIVIAWVSSSVANPIINLVKQTERYGAGDFGIKLDQTKGPDEIQKVSHAFNVMGDAINAQIEELRDTQKEIVAHLARAAEYRDSVTGMHIERMSRYCTVLGKAYGMCDDDCERLLYASQMHDVGKIGIPDGILLKEGALDSNEWKIMLTHPQIGELILSSSNSRLIQLAERVAYTHHEHWDGSGYPRGLKGEEIPIEGRIACLCDVFDSLTMERPYKAAWTVGDAFAEIESKSGIHFDPYLVEIFKGILPEIIRIKKQFAA
ncbi:MAG: hypothetical protein C0392_16265 [Syntrophus sp. (in: bacteria)]|nr:hypothetical protein [Syntrophus sp. (in: bacteria)]